MHLPRKQHKFLKNNLELVRNMAVENYPVSESNGVIYKDNIEVPELDAITVGWRAYIAQRPFTRRLYNGHWYDVRVDDLNGVSRSYHVGVPFLDPREIKLFTFDSEAEEPLTSRKTLHAWLASHQLSRETGINEITPPDLLFLERSLGGLSIQMKNEIALTKSVDA